MKYPRILLALLAAAMLPLTAHAYIGPGAGLGAIAVTIAIGLGFLLLIVGLVWYPLKRVLKGRKKPAEPEETKSEAE